MQFKQKPNEQIIGFEKAESLTAMPYKSSVIYLSFK